MLLTKSLPLTFTTLWTNSADDTLMVHFLFCNFMQTVYIGDNLLEMSKHVFLRKKINMSSAENFIQSDMHLSANHNCSLIFCKKNNRLVI